jgi:hypothetical protein
MTHERKVPADDGLIVADPAGEKFRIRWAKRGTLLRNGSTPWWDGTVSGLVVAVVVTVLGKAFASAQQTWKVGVYRLVSPPRIKSDGPIYRERLRTVYKERLPAGASPNGRVLEIRGIIEAGQLQSLIEEPA